MTKLVLKPTEHHLKGKAGNRRTKDDVREKIEAAIRTGYTVASIAEEYGVSARTVYRIKRQMK